MVATGRIEIKSIEAGQCEVGCTKVRGSAIDQESRNVWLVDQGFSLILRGETAKRWFRERLAWQVLGTEGSSPMLDERELRVRLSKFWSRSKVKMFYTSTACTRFVQIQYVLVRCIVCNSKYKFNVCNAQTTRSSMCTFHSSSVYNMYISFQYKVQVQLHFIKYDV